MSKKNKEIVNDTINEDEILDVKVSDENSKIELTKEEIEAYNNKTLEFEQKAKEAEEKYLRANAELINYRRRKDEETSKILKYCNEDILNDILPVIDNFERALNTKSEDEKLYDGIKMVYNSLNDILKKYGVEEIESKGKIFDPKVHNAVMTSEDKNYDKEIVLEVYQKGYTYKDKLLRPAMVRVNK